jgi:hypothetical protein
VLFRMSLGLRYAPRANCHNQHQQRHSKHSHL